MNVHFSCSILPVSWTDIAQTRRKYDCVHGSQSQKEVDCKSQKMMIIPLLLRQPWWWHFCCSHYPNEVCTYIISVTMATQNFCCYGNHDDMSVATATMMMILLLLWQPWWQHMPVTLATSVTMATMMTSTALDQADHLKMWWRKNLSGSLYYYFPISLK